MRLHTYRAGAGVTHPDVDPGRRVADVVPVEADERAFVVGDGTEIDIDLTVLEVFGDGPGHVITHPCHKVAVAAEYTGRHTRFEVHVAALVSTVLDNAVDRLKIDSATAADLVLRLPCSTDDLVPTRPIGSYLRSGPCEITVDVAHVVRPQG